MIKSLFKKPNTVWVVILGIFLSYIIVGIGVYLWQQDIVKQTKDEKQQTLVELDQKRIKLEKQTVDLTKSTLANLESYKNNVIDLSTFKVGDKLANGMVVESFDSIDRVVSFSGSVVLVGSYKYYSKNDPEYSLFEGRVCLRPENQYFLPNTGLGVQEFCFSNQDVAQNRYGPAGSSGQATVVIDKFSLADQGLALAELVKTIDKK